MSKNSNVEYDELKIDFETHDGEMVAVFKKLRDGEIVETKLMTDDELMAWVSTTDDDMDF